MIRHCVFIRFRTAVSRAERDELFREITGLQSHLAGIVSVHSGANVSPEVGMDQGFTEGFIIDFTGSAHRDDYLADAEHQRIGTRIVAAAQGGSDGVLVFDLEID
ncbi:MAG TPA: Dabb family protein [Ilumatobacteraceae bacterium]|nr:Dabb family protein [Ilumatobacteraceae bacterium]